MIVHYVAYYCEIVYEQHQADVFFLIFSPKGFMQVAKTACDRLTQQVKPLSFLFRANMANIPANNTLF